MYMPENSPPIGAIGQNVIGSVTELRQARGLSLRALSSALGDLGRPILPIGLSRLENGQRKVDAADLVALSVALRVNPSALLFPRHGSVDTVVELAPNATQRLAVVWAWADGRLPLPPKIVPEGTTSVDTPGDRYADYIRHSRPDVSKAIDPAIEELVTLRQMVEDVLADPDRTEKWGHWRDTILRRFRLVAIQLEELFARLDTDALTATAFQFDSAGAAEQLRVAVQEVRQPAVGFMPGREERYRDTARGDRSRLTGPAGPHAAPTSITGVSNGDTVRQDVAGRDVDPLDPFGERGQ